jgi:hypothetical protein
LSYFRNNYLTGVTVVVYKTPNSRIAPEIQTRRESRGFSAFWAIPPIVIPGRAKPSALRASPGMTAFVLEKDENAQALTQPSP